MNFTFNNMKMLGNRFLTTMADNKDRTWLLSTLPMAAALIATIQVTTGCLTNAQLYLLFDFIRDQGEVYANLSWHEFQAIYFALKNLSGIYTRACYITTAEAYPLIAGIASKLYAFCTENNIDVNYNTIDFWLALTSFKISCFITQAKQEKDSLGLNSVVGVLKAGKVTLPDIGYPYLDCVKSNSVNWQDNVNNKTIQGFLEQREFIIIKTEEGQFNNSDDEKSKICRRCFITYHTALYVADNTNYL